ncbi:MAG: exodeoxyribonuclease III [Methylobacteriaceae bacterium]|nr:exodeoxyribonuclease III [Methylobacteriaceae bacterium]MBV9705557.1 exodeoxyribonuclease III [Methylobacteriaceae bacterium]
MLLKLATWNINSVRLRLPLVMRFLKSAQPDVLCLQETKCRDGEFPTREFRRHGYRHVAVHGQKGYHGVAIVSRLPFHEIKRRDFCAKGDARHISMRFDDGAGAAAGAVVHNFYVPAGGDEPDAAVNPKFGHKLAFLDEMTAWMAADGIASERAILVGDLNVAPLETDVWNHKALLRVVSHTPIEVEKLTLVQNSGPWVDAMRRIVAHEEKLFTWWSYRSPNWALVNKGRRLDHVWLSRPLAPALAGMQVLREARGWERTSDHVPVIVDLEL